MKILKRLLGYCEKHRRYGRWCEACVMEAHIKAPRPSVKREISEKIKTRFKKP